MSDDVSMGALSGSLAGRSQAAIAAGCNLVFHCTGQLDEMEEVAAAVPALEGRAQRRTESALASRRGRESRIRELRAEWAALMQKVTPHPEGKLHVTLRIQISKLMIGTDRAASEPALVVDVEGFEGPLDLLLALARQQKVDLAKISILALADQYLAFIEEARKLRLELAADYLVMAAWLAYLKSRLLLPDMGSH